MKKLFALLIFCSLTLPLFSQDSAWLSTLPQAKDYVQKRASSYDRTGGNDDFRTTAAGETLTLLDENGPGLITHIWIAIVSDDPHHLKAPVLRMYWDGESSPSVETPLGDFFGLGLGDYYMYESLPLAVGSDKALSLKQFWSADPWHSTKESAPIALKSLVTVASSSRCSSRPFLMLP